MRGCSAHCCRAGRTRPPDRRPDRCAPICTRVGIPSSVEISQGVEIGRPSTLVAEVEGDRVRVSGGVVTVIRGEVQL